MLRSVPALAIRGVLHVAVEGDGSLLFNIQELETIVRHKMQMVVLVWNDAGYGA